MASPGAGGGQPFDWLSNGLFGRGGVKSNDGSIENCTSMDALWGGVESELNSLLQPAESGAGSGDGGGSEGEREESAKESTSGDNIEASPDGGEGDGPASSLAARLSRIKFLLYDERTSPQPRGSNATSAASAAVESLTRDRPALIPSILGNLRSLPFEARKDVSAVFNYLLVCGCPDDGEGGGGAGGTWRQYVPIMLAFVSYISDSGGGGQRYRDIIAPIIAGHDCSSGPNGAPPPSTPDMALLCGSMLRSTLRHPSLFVRFVSEEFAPLFVYPFLDHYVHQPNFEVASDALETVRVVFTGGSAEAGVSAGGPSPTPFWGEGMEDASSAFLLRDYDEVIDQRFNAKMLSDSASYVTKRASVQLLSTVLLTRSNYAVMMKYISSRRNLITVMFLLRDPSPHITLDAFHVFKVFVANPDKPPEVVKILVDNKEKLVRYLDGLHRDREVGDEQFRDEKALVIATLEGLEL